MDTFMSLKQVIAAVGLSKSQIYQERRAGQFPGPIRATSARKRPCVKWKLSEIEAWMESRPRADDDPQEAA